MAEKLTKTVLDAAVTRGYTGFLWDSSVKGFGIRARTFILQYRNAEGKVKRFTIGKMDDSLTLEQARKLATELYRRVLNGEDPTAAKQQRREAWTVDQLLDA